MLTQMNNNITPQVNGASGAAQQNVATLPATANRTQYLEGFDITGSGATSATVIEVSVTGLKGGTIKYECPIVAGVNLAAFPLSGPIYSIRFPEPLPASGTNIAISVTVPSFGSGNTNASVVAYGFLI